MPRVLVPKGAKYPKKNPMIEVISVPGIRGNFLKKSSFSKEWVRISRIANGNIPIKFY